MLWLAQLAVAGILAMAAFAKLFAFTPEGSLPLAEALGVGRATIVLIGLVEAAAAVLILLPRLQVVGAIAAATWMIGALGTHATRLGWSGSAAAEMWPLALVVLGLSAGVAYARRCELLSLVRR